MKIREKARKFVEEHNKGLHIASQILIGVGVAGIGFVIGEKMTFGRFKALTNIDLSTDYGICTNDVTLSKVWPDEILGDVLESIGFTSLDETAKTAIFIQK